MKRRLNLRFAGWLLLGLGAAVVMIVIAHEVQVRRNAGSLLFQANTSQQKGRFHRAAFYYDNYLSYRPDDTEALIGYAHVLEKTAATPAARYRSFLVLEQAIRRRPASLKLRWEAVRCAQRLFRYSDALHHLRALAKSDDKDGNVYLQMGRCREALGEFKKAEACYRKAIARSPDILSAYAGLGNLLQNQLERPNDVHTLLQEMIVANPKSYRARLVRADYLLAIGNSKDSWQDVSAAWRLAPDKLDVILAKAQMEQEKGQRAQAHATLETGLQSHPKSTKLYKALAWLEMRNNEPKKAIQWLRSGLEKNSENNEFRIALTDLLVSHGDSKEAQIELARLRREQSSTDIADCLQARLWITHGKLSKAIDKLEKIRPNLEKKQFWSAHASFLLGIAYGRLGDLEQALRNYERAVQESPGWTAAIHGLGDTLLRAGHTEKAFNWLTSIKNAQDAPAETAALIANARLAKARALPEDSRDWDEVEKAIKEASASNSGELSVILLKADFLAARREFNKARAILDQALSSASKPNQLRLSIALADIARLEGDRYAAQKLLQQVEKENGISLALCLGWVRYCIGTGGNEARRQLLAIEAKADSLPQQDRVHLWRELARTTNSLGDIRGSGRLWLIIADRFPRDLQSRHSLLNLAMQQRNESKANAALKQIRSIEGERGVLWRWGEAAIHLTFARSDDKERLSKAADRIREIKKLRPGWGRALALEGQLEEMAGEDEKAIQHYMAAANQGDLSPQLTSRLLGLLFERGSFIAVDQVLNKVRQQRPLTKDQSKQLAESALHQNRKQEAIQLARQTIPESARDYRDILWLAGMLNRAGRPNQSELVLRKLLERSPHIPLVWTSLVEHLVETGNQEKARDLLNAARAKAPLESAQYTLARCHEALGNLDSAQSLLERNVQSRPEDFLAWRDLAEFCVRHKQFDLAEVWLTKIVHPANQVPSELVQVARRQLAVALAGQGGDEKFKQALALAPLPAGRGKVHPSDLITRAMVLATRPNYSREAVKLFESAGRQTQLSVQERFTQAKLYLSLGKSEKASGILLGLIVSKGERPQWMAAYIRSLLHGRDATTARVYLDKLAKRHPLHPDLAGLTRELNEVQRQIQSEEP